MAAEELMVVNLEIVMVAVLAAAELKVVVAVAAELVAVVEVVYL